jgi:hypothetical protein
MAGNIARKVILGIDVSQFRKGITQVDAQMKGLSKQMNNLGGLIGATFAVAIVGDFVMESIKLNSELKKAEAGFKRIGASSGDLARLRHATRGLVTDVVLMQKTTQAANFGIPVEKLATLFEFAQRRAAETGESVDYLVNSIVVGLGRKSIKIIDNLGISATALKAEMGGVAVATADIADVTAAVSRIAERSLDDMGDVTVTAADKVEQLRIKWENLKTSVGGPLAGAAVGVIDFINQVPNATKERVSGGQIDYAAVDKDARAAWSKFQNFTGMMGEAVDEPVEAPIIVTLASLREELAQLRTEWESVDVGSQAFTDLAESIKVAEENIKELTQPMREVVEQTDLAAKSWHNVGVEVERTAGIIQKQLPINREMVEDFTKKFEAAAMVGQEFGDILTQSFKTSVETGEAFFDVLGRALKAYVAELLAAVAATIALSAIMSAMTGATFGATFNTVSKGTQVGGWMDIVGMLRGKDLVMSTTRSGNALNRSGGAF